MKEKDEEMKEWKKQFEVALGRETEHIKQLLAQETVKVSNRDIQIKEKVKDIDHLQREKREIQKRLDK